MTSTAGDENTGKSVGAWIESELSSAWQRKAAFETRGFSVITADIAVVGLYFALQKQTISEHVVYVGGWKAVLIAAICLVVASIIAGTLCAAPLNYPTPKLEAFDLLYKRIASETDAQQSLEIIEGRIYQLKAAIKSNRIKGRCLLAAFGLFSLAMILFVTLFAHLIAGASEVQPDPLQATVSHQSLAVAPFARSA